MHTIYCDGKASPEQMVISAMEKGMECIGFSGHSFVEFDRQCGMDEKNAALYFNEIKSLKEKYRDRIRIYCGIEQDAFSGAPGFEPDYIIGSVHYLRVPADSAREIQSPLKHDRDYVYISVDDTPEELSLGVQEYFGGDYIAAARNYFDLLSDVVNVTNADIIGHFDLISKFNEKCGLFDEHDPDYIRAWQTCADRLIGYGRFFEINTGGMARGWKSTPYPSEDMIRYIKARGGRFVLSGDSHSPENIAFGFNSV